MQKIKGSSQLFQSLEREGNTYNIRVFPVTPGRLISDLVFFFFSIRKNCLFQPLPDNFLDRRRTPAGSLLGGSTPCGGRCWQPLVTAEFAALVLFYAKLNLLTMSPTSLKEAGCREAAGSTLTSTVVQRSLLCKPLQPGSCKAGHPCWGPQPLAMARPGDP